MGSLDTPPADALIALFTREGYARVEPPILQPTDPFIDLSGEDLRRRMFVTQDGDGREHDRPERTGTTGGAHGREGRTTS